MSYQISNTLLQVSIILASLSFAYTIPLFPIEFPFHIVIIIAYAYTAAYHTFLLWATSLKKPYTLKIALDADPEADQQAEVTTLFSIQSSAVFPSSGLGIMFSFSIATLWVGAAISRMVFMILHWGPPIKGLMFLVLEAAVTTYLAFHGLTCRLKEDSTGFFADWQAATMRSIDDIFMRLGQLQTAISTPMNANADHTEPASTELRERSSAGVTKERKDI